MVLDNLEPFRDRIHGAIHFEPLYERHGDSLIGLLRRRFTEVTGHNRTLLSRLEAHPSVEILEVKEDVIGVNPLNPTSIVHWRYR